MSLHIPSDVANIIFEYYAQLRDMKWVPFIDGKTGKLKWNVNKYSAKYDNMNKLLKHRKDNLCDNVNIDVEIIMRGETIDFISTIGTSICLKTTYKVENFVDNYQVIITKYDLYIEYYDSNNFKYSIFCSKFGRSTLRRHDFDIYQDGNIHSNLLDIHIFGKNTYSLVIEKY
jgi:hypothetical protein